MIKTLGSRVKKSILNLQTMSGSNSIKIVNLFLPKRVPYHWYFLLQQTIVIFVVLIDLYRRPLRRIPFAGMIIVIEWTKLALLLSAQGDIILIKYYIIMFACTRFISSDLRSGEVRPSIMLKNCSSNSSLLCCEQLPEHCGVVSPSFSP